MIVADLKQIVKNSELKSSTPSSSGSTSFSMPCSPSLLKSSSNDTDGDRSSDMVINNNNLINSY